MQQGLLGRISRTSIMEYHAFGIISEGRNSPHHYMICGVQGDFTKTLVVDPPKTVWTRELKFGISTPLAISFSINVTSWCWACIRNVQKRYSHLHWNRNW